VAFSCPAQPGPFKPSRVASRRHVWIGCLGEMSLKEAEDGDWPYPRFSRFQGLANGGNVVYDWTRRCRGPGARSLMRRRGNASNKILRASLVACVK
jgi:hypothetical protein